MKFNKLTNKIKLSSALIAATTVVGGGILSVPLLLSTNNTNKQIISSNSDYKNLIDQDNNQTTGSSDLSSQPAAIQNFFLNKKTRIYANNYYSIFAVVTRDDDSDVLYAWGRNAYGQLGLGINDKNNRTFPTLVTIGTLAKYKITHIASSLCATTVVINGYQIWNAGSNTQCEFGNGTKNSSEIFVQNNSWDNSIVKSIHAGYYHRVVVTTDNKVWVWGMNSDGHLGTGSRNDEKITPFELTDIIEVAYPNWMAGEFYVTGYNTALLIDGDIYIWGTNFNGAAGNKSSVDYVLSPPSTPVDLETKISKYSMGLYFSIALLENGNLWAWGQNDNGQLGVGTYTAANPTPLKVTRKQDGTPIGVVTELAASGGNSYIKIGAKIYSSGSNSKGQLAQNTAVTKLSYFDTVKTPSGAQILDFIALYDTLIVRFDSALQMAGSNSFGQFANGTSTDSNPSLVSVTPFGTPAKLKTKLDNKQYKADAIVNDLNNNKGNVQTIKTTLAKYVDGVESLTGSTLTYKTNPIASVDKDKVTATLSSNGLYNADGAKTNLTFDVDVEISNFEFKDSKVTIKTTPTNVNTGTIDEILNPNPGFAPSTRWVNEIVDMNNFPLTTTFTKILNDEIIVGPGTNDSIYRGNIVPSRYYWDNKVVNNTTDKSFIFEITGISRVADSQFTSGTISDDLNKDNIVSKLETGQPLVEDKYISMFVDKTTFPAGTTFTISNSIVNEKAKTYSGIIAFDKYYRNGRLHANGTKNFVLNNIKTIKTSALVFNGLSDDSIHSANIEELLKAADNTDTINKLFDISLFPSNVKFTVSGTPALNKEAKTYVGKFTATQAYDNWNTVSNKEVPFEVSNITIFNNSSVDYFELPSEYNIENIEASLINGSKINLEVLKKLININRFPPNTTFTMGVINKDINGGKYTFEIIPNRHYVDGIAVDNSATKTPYSVTIQFAVPPNLGLIIGLSVGGAALIGLILLSYFKRYELEIVWWNMRATKYKK